MLDFRMQLDFKLIENVYVDQEEAALCHRSTRIQEGIGHGLLSLPPFKTFCWTRIVSSMSKYPQKMPLFQKRDTYLL